MVAINSTAAKNQIQIDQIWVVISGNIGVGKSTLIDGLKKHFSEANIVPEDFHKVTNLGSFY